MNRIIKGLFLSTSLILSAQQPTESLKWATEADVLPFATGGWYASIAAGRDVWRLRLVVAEVNVPEAFAPKGWKDARTKAQALLVDRFFCPGLVGPWVGAGVERWDEDLKRAQGQQHVRMQSLQATLGAGWVVPLGRGFYVNPWLALHQRIGGDRSAAIPGAECRPKALQAEASVKIGYAF
ncbi:MAG: hypothetical protein H6Q00_1505 [Holophagaceae bacterium]|nr:hypothetical protein [Holophagaceae bacterium]